ncbi:MAG: hypothetical protein E6G41_13420 [Actinobacteria bacterium]|nr:MAG: hypothetical protein E6G41_13420 [Actinomycetota bacterium]
MPRRAYATPVSSTATITPRPPGAPALIAFCQASGAFTLNGPVKFHCTLTQSPGIALRPGSSGMNADACALTSGTA